MGTLQVIFQTDSGLIDELGDKGTLKDFEFNLGYQRGNARGKYFNTEEGYRFCRLGCFVSQDYEANYGDFSNFRHPVLTEEKFGPAPVFGMSVNTADRRLIDGNLKQVFEELERHVPGARNRLSYIGISYNDHDALIFKDELKDKIEHLLRA